ncbi:IS1182 family transposase [Thalassomonas viridans]|uniref:IS1182 family transposase n=1 Tax=Thalassomonas viridans TaxID=137584 RepID=A0AAF0CAR0_9GAMM|nr:IS1182 family transposase [Thalassomonas viridans]WDE04471.1 IS1182 family transposase [Thalassomonas viridans]WDE06036.1 IS1182 family transposase [Thalassomonas viridans]WDE07153.1 IS1182 family transposase [Thalassomonas viridans]WDE07563.1 IS1182 family transposase [Thalassomonas viridans]WDE08695.1 IS1182 family transposase [Thalassomonas viridans]
MTNNRHWECPVSLSKKEKLICSKLKNHGKLFVFLRNHRHAIFNDEINQQLIAMYADHPKGKPPVPAAQLAMATLLQSYEQKSDAGATLDAMFDMRWKMVLNCLSDETAPFSQGTLCDFRHRLIKHNMDVILLEHTVNIAKEFGGFGHQQLRIALDSAPLQGAGRVEDTFNLVGHALELLIDCVAHIKQTSEEKIIAQTRVKLIGKSSIKAALDIDWSDPNEKYEAINTLLLDVERLQQWLEAQPNDIREHKALKECLLLLETVLEQNIEPDPDGGSRIKQGTAAERRISVSDKDMRHGRKSSSRTINGFKQHIAVDLESKLILATCVRPANEPEHKASRLLKPKVLNYGSVSELSIDRGYLAADWTVELYHEGKNVVAKPWTAPAAPGKFSKKSFSIDLVGLSVTCPNDIAVPIKGKKQKQAKFPVNQCNECMYKSKCTDARNGRVVSIHANERMMQDLAYYVETTPGRADARERVKVEHSLASVCNRKGPRARYRGLRLNEFDLNRTAMITNLHISLNLAA